MTLCAPTPPLSRSTKLVIPPWPPPRVQSIGIAHIDNFFLGAYHNQQAAGDLPQPGPANVSAERRSSLGPGAPEPRTSGALAGSGTGEAPARPRRRSVRRSSHKDVDMGPPCGSAEPSAMTTDTDEVGQLPPLPPPPPPPPPLPVGGGFEGAGTGAGGMDASMSEAGAEPMDSAPHEPRQSEGAGSVAGQQPRTKDLCIMIQLLKRRQDQSGGWDVFRIPHLVSRPFQVGLAPSAHTRRDRAQPGPFQASTVPRIAGRSRSGSCVSALLSARSCTVLRSQHVPADLTHAYCLPPGGVCVCRSYRLPTSARSRPACPGASPRAAPSGYSPYTAGRGAAAAPWEHPAAAVTERGGSCNSSSSSSPVS